MLISLLYIFISLQIFCHRTSLLFGHLDKGIEPGNIILENVTTPVNQLIAHFHITPTENGTKLACIQTKDTKTYACIFLLTEYHLATMRYFNDYLLGFIFVFLRNVDEVCMKIRIIPGTSKFIKLNLLFYNLHPKYLRYFCHS